MPIYVKVNNYLRPSGYRRFMLKKRRRPGSPKGQPKPLRRALDPDFHKRLNAAMRQYDLDVPQTAKGVRCTRAGLLKHLSGKSKAIEALFLFDLADFLKVSARWLLTGKGAMAMVEALTPDQTRVLQTFSQLTDEGLRDYWISQGDELQRRQPALIASTADPFNGATTQNMSKRSHSKRQTEK